MPDKILDSTEMRFRIIDLEYNNLPEEEFIEQLEKIYIEEYGEKLPAEVEIFHLEEHQILKMIIQVMMVLPFISTLKKCILSLRELKI